MIACYFILALLLVQASAYVLKMGQWLLFLPPFLFCIVAAAAALGAGIRLRSRGKEPKAEFVDLRKAEDAEDGGIIANGSAVTLASLAAFGLPHFVGEEVYGGVVIAAIVGTFLVICGIRSQQFGFVLKLVGVIVLFTSPVLASILLTGGPH